MRRRIGLLAVTMSAGLGTAAGAGPYSSGLQNTTAGAVDPGIPGFVGTVGVGKSAPPNTVNPLFVGWATGYQDYLPAPGVDTGWNDPSVAIGPVSGNNFDVVSLGDLSASQITSGVQPGHITLSFISGISNGTGADFAVFENAFGSDASVFAELAYVEVSSDGTHFSRFPSRSLTPSAVSPYGFSDPTNLYNLAGKHINSYGNSWGTPFDLSDLTADSLVTSGLVNLANINYVRLVDIPGTGAFLDSQANPIYDPSVTTGSGGFDLQAVGVINSVPEPTGLLGVSLALLTLVRRTRLVR